MADKWISRQHEKDFIAAKLRKKAAADKEASKSRDEVVSGLRKDEGSYYGKTTGLPSASKRGYKVGDRVGEDEIARQATAMIDAMAKGYDPEQARQISLKARNVDNFVIDPAETASAASSSVKIQKVSDKQRADKPAVNKPLAVGAGLLAAGAVGYAAAGGKSAKLTKNKTPEQLAKMHPVDRAAYERKAGKTVLKAAREMSAEDINVSGAGDKADEIKLKKAGEELLGKKEVSPIAPAAKAAHEASRVKPAKVPEGPVAPYTTLVTKPKGRVRATGNKPRQTLVEGIANEAKARREGTGNPIAKKSQSVEEIVQEAQAKPVPREVIAKKQEQAIQERGGKPAIKLSKTQESVAEIKRLKAEKAKAATDEKRTPEQRTASQKTIESRIENERRSMIERRLNNTGRKGGYNRRGTLVRRKFQGGALEETNIQGEALEDILMGKGGERTIVSKGMQGKPAQPYTVYKTSKQNKPQVGEIFTKPSPGISDEMRISAEQKAKASISAIKKGKSPISTSGSAPQPDVGSINRAKESPAKGGIDPVVAETKTSPKGTYHTIMKDRGMARGAKETGTIKAPVRVNKTITPIDSPIALKQKAAEIKSKGGSTPVASPSTPPGKIADSQNDITQALRDQEANNATKTVRPPKGTPVTVAKRATGAPKQTVEEIARPSQPAKSAILRKKKPVVEPVPANPKGTPTSVTTKPAPIEASIPLKQKAQELAGMKREAEQPRGSRPGKQKVPMPRSPEDEAKIARRQRVAPVDKALPSKPPGKIADSQDDINKLLRDQEADLASERAMQVAPRGKAVPEAETKVPVAAGQTHEAKTAAQKKAERDAILKKHMKEKGYTKVSAPNEAGEVVTAKVSPRAKKAVRAKALAPPPEKPVSARSTEIGEISPSKAVSVAEQVSAKAPATEGAMGAALRKAASKVKGGKALGVAGGLFAGLAIAQAAKAAPEGQKVKAATSEGRSQAKFALGAAAASRAFPALTSAVAVPAASLATGFSLGQAAHAGYETAKAYREASAEKKGSEAKYGTIAKAAETRRKMQEDKKNKKKMTLDEAGNLMSRWK